MTRIHGIAAWAAAVLGAAALGCDSGKRTEALEARIAALEQRVAVLERSRDDAGQLAGQIHEQELRELGGKPGPIASTGAAVTQDTPLRAGQLVQLEWNGAWWAARVVGLLPDGRVRVHYLGWEPRWDEEVPRSRLQLDPDAWAKARATLLPRPR
jgi:hypothetical protein